MTSLWCDTFDADLLKVVPDAAHALGAAGDVELITHCRPGPDGRINHPVGWWTDHGLTSFFSTPDRPPAPAGYWTLERLVPCTFLDVVRDEWIHGAAVVVHGQLVWRPPQDAFARLMSDVRGWARASGDVMGDTEREWIRSMVVLDLAAAAERLTDALGRAA